MSRRQPELLGLVTGGRARLLGDDLRGLLGQLAGGQAVAAALVATVTASTAAADGPREPGDTLSKPPTAWPAPWPSLDQAQKV